MAESAWHVFEYELNMFLTLRDLCSWGASYPQPIPNAITESRLLHIRNLCDILLSRGTESDEITLKTLLPQFHSTKLGELKALYGNRMTPNSPCWTLNKRLAHSTLVRTDSDGFDYTSLFQQLEPVIQSLIDEIEEARATQ